MRMKNLCTADVIANHRFKTEPCVQKPVCSNTQSFFLPIFHRFTHIFLFLKTLNLSLKLLIILFLISIKRTTIFTLPF